MFHCFFFKEVMRILIEAYVEWYFIIKVSSTQQCKPDWKRTIRSKVVVPESLFTVQLSIVYCLVNKPVKIDTLFKLQQSTFNIKECRTIISYSVKCPKMALCLPAEGGGVRGLFWKRFVLKLGLVTLHYKDLVTLNILAPKHFF